MTPPARYGAARAIAVALLALAVGVITAREVVTTVAADARRPSTEGATALLSNDAVHGGKTVGVQPPRTPTVGRAADVATVRSVVPAVATPAAGLACVGASLWSRRRADDELCRRGPVAWAGPGGRRAPPVMPAA